jgi:hypothetical protein
MVNTGGKKPFAAQRLETVEDAKADLRHRDLRILLLQDSTSGKWTFVVAVKKRSLV